MSLDSRSNTLMLLVAVAFTLVGLACLVPGALLFRRQTLLTLRGTEVEATVEATSSVSRAMRGEARPGRSYFVTYAFQTRDGRPVSSKRAVSDSFYHDVKRGDAIVVVYDPDDPERSAPREDVWRWQMPALFLLFGLAFGFGGPSVLVAELWAGWAARGVPDLGGRLETLRSAPRGMKFLKTTALTLTLNGFVGVVGWVVWDGRATQPGATMVGLAFLGFFGLIGLAMLAGLPLELLRLFGPRPLLSSTSPIRPGETQTLEWTLPPSSGIRHLSLVLEGGSRGGAVRKTLVDSGDQIESGTCTYEIPEVAGPQIWLLKLVGRRRPWPDVRDEFPLRIRRGA